MAKPPQSLLDMMVTWADACLAKGDAGLRTEITDLRDTIHQLKEASANSKQRQQLLEENVTLRRQLGNKEDDLSEYQLRLENLEAENARHRKSRQSSNALREHSVEQAIPKEHKAAKAPARRTNGGNSSNSNQALTSGLQGRTSKTPRIPRTPMTPRTAQRAHTDEVGQSNLSSVRTTRRTQSIDVTPSPQHSHQQIQVPYTVVPCLLNNDEFSPDELPLQIQEDTTKTINDYLGGVGNKRSKSGKIKPRDSLQPLEANTCLSSRMKRQTSKFSHGEWIACDECVNKSNLCIIVKTNVIEGKNDCIILPQPDAGRKKRSPKEDPDYWKTQR